MSLLSAEVVYAGAVQTGVCVRPIVRRLVDTVTGESRLVPIPCGSTLDKVCPPCADKARKLRMQQCREGWHLLDDPLPPQPDHDQDDPVDEDNFDQDGDGDDGDRDDGDRRRRVRSTRRRRDVPQLPRLPIERRTIGRAFQAPDGKVWRPSMFITLTLGSYGPVRGDGTPVDPESYDYRRAGLDAIHLPELFDRFIQNLRRVVGYQVQYFAAVEPQRRLAPHLHIAIRGVIPRRLLRQVVAATYHQVWWPACDHIVYREDHPPVWDETTGGYVDPDTAAPLPTWNRALDRLDEDPQAAPAHVLRFGTQTHIQGVIGGKPATDRLIGYLAKYLTKAITDPLHPDDDEEQDQGSPARREHVDRLHQQVRLLPCSPKCWNWLAYGIQPKGAEPGMAPGQCPAKHHHDDHLGCGGRRVLVSRYWTGKTLAEHKADRIDAVRAVLEAAGVDMPDADRCASSATGPDGDPRYAWEPLDPDQVPSYLAVISASVAERNRWRTQYDQAKQRAGPPFGNSATEDAA